MWTPGLSHDSAIPKRTNWFLFAIAGGWGRVSFLSGWEEDLGGRGRDAAALVCLKWAPRVCFGRGCLAWPLFQEEKETCSKLLWLISSICLMASTWKSKENSNNESNDVHCYKHEAPSSFAATQVIILWLSKEFGRQRDRVQWVGP